MHESLSCDVVTSSFSSPKCRENELGFYFWRVEGLALSEFLFMGVVEVHRVVEELSSQTAMNFKKNIGQVLILGHILLGGGDT